MILSKYQFSEERYFLLDRRSIPNLLNISAEYDYSSMSYARNEQLLLSGIEYSGGGIDFGYSNRSDLQQSKLTNITEKLSFISVYENISNESQGKKKKIKDCTLSHSYRGTGYEYQRLRLDGVCFNPIDGSQNDGSNSMKYEFGYHPGILPSKYSQSFDYWGYYNNGSFIKGNPSEYNTQYYSNISSPAIYYGTNEYVL